MGRHHRSRKAGAVLLQKEQLEHEAILQEQTAARIEKFERRKNKKPISVYVQILTGRKIHIFVDDKYDTLLDIQKKIQNKEGIHPDQQTLLLNGIRLVASSLHTVRDLRIRDGVTLFLTLRNRGG